MKTLAIIKAVDGQNGRVLHINMDDDFTLTCVDEVANEQMENIKNSSEKQAIQAIKQMYSLWDTLEFI